MTHDFVSSWVMSVGEAVNMMGYHFYDKVIN